ncbi:GIY-YIG nuclease family protein [bacterium]|nr:GIY-YIG nuclease family protein [bacterium]
MKYYIYILYSSVSDRYYVGQSYDVQTRLKDHNEGNHSHQSTKYTFKHRPWELKASFFVSEDRGKAMKIERYIKRQKSRKFIEQLIAVHLDRDGLAQLIRVPMSRD